MSEKRLSEKELSDMRERITADVVDDGEEVLFWFAEHGHDMIDEILELRSKDEMKTVDIYSKAGSAKGIITEPIEHLQQSWYNGEFFETRLLEYIYWHFKGGVFVDVGSAIGNHSLFFAKFCEPKLVISVEPVKASVERQCQLFELNYVTNRILISNVALSDQPGEGAMEPFANRNLGQFRLVPGNDVEVHTLDYLLNYVKGRITLVKIDVEGHELRVLHGAERTLREKRPALFIEIRSRSAYNAIVNYLGGFGYEQVGSVFQDATVYEFGVK